MTSHSFQVWGLQHSTGASYLLHQQSVSVSFVTCVFHLYNSFFGIMRQNVTNEGTTKRIRTLWGFFSCSIFMHPNIVFLYDASDAKFCIIRTFVLGGGGGKVINLRKQQVLIKSTMSRLSLISLQLLLQKWFSTRWDTISVQIFLWAIVSGEQMLCHSSDKKDALLP